MSLLLVEKRDHVALLTLNRPESMNALGAIGDGEAIRVACEEINRDRDIRCAILTGAGRSFSAGGDVKSMLEKKGAFAGDGIDIRENYRREFHALSSAIYGLEMPVIAAVNGAAVGLGCDLACLADIRIASDTARFGVTFLKVGLDSGRWWQLVASARHRVQPGGRNALYGQAHRRPDRCGVGTCFTGPSSRAATRCGVSARASDRGAAAARVAAGQDFDASGT